MYINYEKINKKLLIQIFYALIFTMIIPLLINKLLIKNILNLLSIKGEIVDLIRISISGAIFSYIGYYVYFKKIWKKDIILYNKKSFVQIFIGTINGALSIIIIIGILFIFGMYSVISAEITWYTLYIAFYIFTFAFIEELIFRGILYKLIEERYGTFISLFTTGFLFSLVHISNDNFTVMSFINIFIGGIMVGIMYTYTKQLWLPVFFHFSWNLTQVLFGVTLSGEELFSKGAIAKAELVGAKIFTGGDFGPENSIFALLLTLIILIIYLIKSIKKDKYIFMKTNKKGKWVI